MFCWTFLISGLHLSLPDPGAHGSVVEDNRSVGPNKHWLTVLVDDVIVSPEFAEDCLTD